MVLTRHSPLLHPSGFRRKPESRWVSRVGDGVRILLGLPRQSFAASRSMVFFVRIVNGPRIASRALRSNSESKKLPFGHQ